MTILAYDGSTFSVDSRTVSSQKVRLHSEAVQYDDGVKYDKITWNDGEEHLIFFLGEQPQEDIIRRAMVAMATSAYKKMLESGKAAAEVSVMEKMKGLHESNVDGYLFAAIASMHVVVIDRSASMMELDMYLSDTATNDNLPEGLTVSITLYHRDMIVAWGTGEGVALGAMRSGANSRKAVEIACRYTTTCGGPIHTFNPSKLKKAKTPPSVKAVREKLMKG